VTKSNVSFKYKDCLDATKQKWVDLKETRFLRRLAVHNLLSGFISLRLNGFLALKNKAKELDIAKVELKQSIWEKQKNNWIEIYQQKLDRNPPAYGHF